MNLQVIYGEKPNIKAFETLKATGFWDAGHIVKTDFGLGVEMNEFAHVGSVKIMGIVLCAAKIVDKLPPVGTNVMARVSEFVQVVYSKGIYEPDTAPTAKVLYRVTKIRTA